MTMNNSSNFDYQTPQAVVLTLVVEQVIAASAGNNLNDMDKNDVYDEIF